MKSAAMRRVDSNDGNVNAATPQATSTSTPASAEKPRVNGESSHVHAAETSKLRTDEKRFTAQANKLKHKMDDILKTKGAPGARDAVPEKERKLGLAIGLECIVLYMSAFTNNVRIMKLQGQPPVPANWESLIKLWEFTDMNCRRFKGSVLEALSCRLGALCREELRRVCLDEREVRVAALKSNEREGSRLWKMVSATREVLEGLGVKGELGPWSSVQDVTAFVVGALGKWSEKEGLGWKRDV